MGEGCGCVDAEFVAYGLENAGADGCVGPGCVVNFRGFEGRMYGECELFLTV